MMPMRTGYFVNIQKDLQKPSYTESIWDSLDEAIEEIERQGYTKVSENLWELRSFVDGQVCRYASVSTQLLPF